MSKESQRQRKVNTKTKSKASKDLQVFFHTLISAFIFLCRSNGKDFIGKQNHRKIKEPESREAHIKRNK